MTIKSKTQPLCRYCGKPIAKRTESVNFNERPSRPDLRGIKPLSRAEAQRLVNGKIVSVRWTVPKRLERGEFEPTGEPRFISQVGLWDGESYVDEFFCNGDHAKSFGYSAAQKGMVTAAWQAATLKRRAA